MIALVLAGGKGKRLGKIGRFIPKPLIPLGDLPVINLTVNRLLERGARAVYILLGSHTREDSSGQPVSMDRWFGDWQRIWYDSEERVKLVYEGEYDAAWDCNGAIAGLLCFLDGKLSKDKLAADERIVVAAGDSYFEDDFSGLLRESEIHEDAIVNAYYDFGSPEPVQEKYGVIEVANDGWATAYVEKPKNPTQQQTKASVALYVYRYKHFMLIRDYAEQIRCRAKSESDGKCEYSLEAPGSLLQWFIMAYENGPRVRAVGLEGSWFDIGDRDTLLRAASHYADRTLRGGKTAT